MRIVEPDVYLLYEDGKKILSSTDNQEVFRQFDRRLEHYTKEAEKYDYLKIKLTANGEGGGGFKLINTKTGRLIKNVWSEME